MSELTLNKENFEQSVLQPGCTALVDFWATWCMPCRMIAPIVEEIAAERADTLTVGKVNVDEAPELAMKYGVSSIPTLILFRDGREAGRTVGAQGKEQLDACIDGCKGRLPGEPASVFLKAPPWRRFFAFVFYPLFRSFRPPFIFKNFTIQSFFFRVLYAFTKFSVDICLKYIWLFHAVYGILYQDWTSLSNETV